MTAAQPVELRHLRYFMRVAEELHFGRAAEMLGLSQAPLSQQIRQLEERLGVRLFDRTTRSVRLTPAGQVFLNKAKETLRALEDSIRAAQSEGGVSAGELRLGVVQVGISTFLPGALAAFAARYPAVRLDINLNTTEEQLEMLADGRIDAAFVRPPRSLSGISYREIYREGFVAVLPAASTLAGKADLAIADLAGERFVTYSSIVGIAYQDVVFQHARAAGFHPQVVYEVSHTLGIVTLVAAGLGVGVIPAWVEAVPVAGVVYRPMPNLPQAVSLVVAWRTDNIKPFLRDFIDCTEAAALRSATRTAVAPRPSAGRRTRRN